MRTLILFCALTTYAYSQQPTLAPEGYVPNTLAELRSMRAEIRQMRVEIAATQREINYEFARVRAVVGILRDRQMQIHRVLNGERVKLWEVTP